MNIYVETRKVLFTCQFQQIQGCKPLTSLQKPPHRSSPPHCVESQGPPELQ